MSRALYVTPAGIDLTNVGLTPDAPCAAGEDAVACARKALLPPSELGYVRTPYLAVVCIPSRRRSEAQELRKNELICLYLWYCEWSAGTWSSSAPGDAPGASPDGRHCAFSVTGGGGGDDSGHFFALEAFSARAAAPAVASRGIE